MKNIYLSTLAFKNDIWTTYKNCLNFNVGLEFSSGVPYNNDNLNAFKTISKPKLSHNYFPAPKKEFVLNLASKNEKIRRRSIEHCIHNLELSAKYKTEFYAAHAGFCLDPGPSQLGKKILSTSAFSKTEHFKIFLLSVEEILEVAEKLEVLFLIENNVLSQLNLKANKIENPFLCCSSDDIIKLFGSVKSNFFGLLLDTGHLKVSTNSLNLDLVEEYTKIRNFVKAIHHSDNDGLNDSNQIISEKYWFLDFLKNHKDIPHIIETKDMSNSSIEKTLTLLNQND